MMMYKKKPRIISAKEARKIAFGVLEKHRKEWADYIAEEERRLTAFDDD